ncbi:hypothetical protein [Mangrovihabitans endophyticus]|uniref:hypothetical protein n=1 Tax=Mangrovihabitans endophyticus TaxID=1751298 RepID=UPI001666D337|nr:hypothetical protein [Mangrovihabitans endophyticus]
MAGLSAVAVGVQAPAPAVAGWCGWLPHGFVVAGVLAAAAAVAGAWAHGYAVRGRSADP